MKLENIMRVLQELTYIKVADRYNDGNQQSIVFRYGDMWWKLTEHLEVFYLSTFGSTMSKLIGNKSTNATTIAKWVFGEINNGDDKCAYNDFIPNIIDDAFIRLIKEKEGVL